MKLVLLDNNNNNNNNNNDNITLFPTLHICRVHTLVNVIAKHICAQHINHAYKKMEYVELIRVILC